MNDLTVTEPKQDQMMMIIEKVMMDPNCDVDKMDKIISLQERMFDKNAQISFSKAMVACQRDMPMVASTAQNKQTHSTYVKYEHLMQQTKSVYVKHGFALSFGEEMCSKKDNITVSCDVVHMDGFSKKYESTLPMDSCGIKGSVNKTGIHATASAYTYAKRYLFTMIFNIAVADHDDDAIKAGGVTYELLLDYNWQVRKHFNSIAVIKQGIEDDQLDIAAEAWFELDKEEKLALWKAPSKGGIFTTAEIKAIKSDEFAAFNPLRLNEAE